MELNFSESEIPLPTKFFEDSEMGDEMRRGKHIKMMLAMHIKTNRAVMLYIIDKISLECKADPFLLEKVVDAILTLSANNNLQIFDLCYGANFQKHEVMIIVFHSSLPNPIFDDLVAPENHVEKYINYSEKKIFWEDDLGDHQIHHLNSNTHADICFEAPRIPSKLEGSLTKEIQQHEPNEKAKFEVGLLFEAPNTIPDYDLFYTSDFASTTLVKLVTALHNCHGEVLSIKPNKMKLKAEFKKMSLSNKVLVSIQLFNKEGITAVYFQRRSGDMLWFHKIKLFVTQQYELLQVTAPQSSGNHHGNSLLAMSAAAIP